MSGMGPSKPKRWVRLIVSGLVSLSIYILMFAFQEKVLDYSTRGSWYSVLLIVTVLVVALVHGSFASSLLSVLGVRPLNNCPSSQKEA